MVYFDPVYGQVAITEPVILDLLQSPSMERIKGVDQAGYGAIHLSEGPHSRFEHSVGVYLLLRRYGAPLPEQVAGLLHDVSHSVFSHAIDYILPTGAEHLQDYQDNIHRSFVLQTEIPAILQRHGMAADDVAAIDRFALLEQQLPDLCADRIDYCLRDAVHYAGIERSEVMAHLGALSVSGNRWVFRSIEEAERFARLFRSMNTEWWSGMRTAVMFHTVGACLRYALRHGYISTDDLYTTESVVLEKISQHLDRDARLESLYERMNQKVGTRPATRDHHEVRVVCKSRVVDPWCHHAGRVQRLSAIDPRWGQVVAEELGSREHFFTFVS